MTRPRLHALLPVMLALLSLALTGACGGDAGGPGPSATPVATPSPAEAEALLAEREARSLARDPSPQATAPAPKPAPSGADEVLTVSVRLLDPEANALSGGTLVWLAPGSGFLTEMRGSARSDGTGAAWLRIPWNQLDSSEQLILALHAGGHVRLELRLEPERWMASPLLNLGEMTLAPGGVVSGRVLDAGGAGVAGAVAAVTLELGARTGLAREMARVWPLYEGVGVAGVVPVVRCGADGAFLLEGVPPGRFDVLAAPYGGATALLPDREEAVEVRAGATTRVRDLVLRPPAPEELIRGRVIAPDGAPVPEAWIALAQADGMEIYEGRTQTGADGTFALPAMKDTVYRVLALDGQGRWPQAEIPDVRPGGAEVIVPFTR